MMPLEADLPGSVDLDLLQTFEAVYLTRNVARAAERLNLSQPLVSQRLTRLRLLLRDQLFVRAPRGVAPTELALSIAPSIHRNLNELRETLDGVRSFDPATAERQFVFHMTDSAELAFFVPLQRYLREVAPGIVLKSTRLKPDAIVDALDTRAIHMAVGVFPALGPAYERAHLLTQDHQLVMGAHHPASGRDIGLADLKDLDFLMIGEFADVERLMAEHGLTGRIAQRVGHYLSAPLLLDDGHLVAWLPRSLVIPLQVYGRYRAVSIPEMQQVFSISLIRSRRGRHDPGLQWIWETAQRLLNDDVRRLGTDLTHPA